ncbi:hypothetical protein A4A49_23076 [Nicotiana attenuata]|uniref:SWIM-type domain-containing protein n=1 Tax=Nicotiana attenuata TaxID=49451 RepID=A0A1J6KSZ1_NICAT|nr:hypothetical protein A4A49_23076 [Nicotiana attenuata]
MPLKMGKLWIYLCLACVISLLWSPLPPPPMLEYSVVSSSGVSFNDAGVVGEESSVAFDEVGTDEGLTSEAPIDEAAQNPNNPNENKPNPAGEPIIEGDQIEVDDDVLEEGESDKDTESSSTSEHDELFEEGVEDYGSDVHEEFRDLRQELRSFQKKKERNLQENISKSMKRTIHWNSEYGYEIEEGLYKKHIVSIDSLSCSCRAWLLRGIPCQHAIAAMHFKKLEPISMDMWPQSENPLVAPPEIKSMPGRPKKLRRKEATESRKIEKFYRCGGQVTCSLCKSKWHNKRGCPHAEGSTSTAVDAAASASSTYWKRMRNPTGSGPFKRPRMVGVGLMVADNGYTAFNPRLPSQRVVNLGAITVTSSTEVT